MRKDRRKVRRISPIHDGSRFRPGCTRSSICGLPPLWMTSLGSCRAVASVQQVQNAKAYCLEPSINENREGPLPYTIGCHGTPKLLTLCANPASSTNWIWLGWLVSSLCDVPESYCRPAYRSHHMRGRITCSTSACVHGRCDHCSEGTVLPVEMCVYRYCKEGLPSATLST